MAFLIWLIAYQALASHWVIVIAFIMLATFYLYERDRIKHLNLNIPTIADNVEKPKKLDVKKLVGAQIYPTLILDEKDNIFCSNQAMLALFKTALNEVDAAYYQDQHLSSLIRVPQIIEFFEQVKNNSQPAAFNFQLNSDGGRYFWLHIAPLNINSGQIYHSFTFRDLTEDQKINQMRTDFIANASHELRTPLASISGFIETLQGSAGNDKNIQQKFLSIMSEQAARMTRLIDDLLSLSKIEMNIRTLPDDVVDLCDVAEHSLKILAPIAHDKHINLRFLKNAETAYIKGDRDQLIQLFCNLLDNAFKYGLIANKENNEVVLSIKIIDNNAFEIIVKDFGNGIPKIDLPRLTERFYRVNSADKTEGTGLGLAIVKHIINRHDAKIRFSSILGQGTQVHLIFKKHIP